MGIVHPLLLYTALLTADSALCFSAWKENLGKRHFLNFPALSSSVSLQRSNIFDPETDSFKHVDEARRKLLIGGTFSALSFFMPSPFLRPALAAVNKSEGLVSAEHMADLLHAVPTFTIVDKQGIPFMVVGEDAKVTGYFFTEFDEAQRILDLARTSADRLITEFKAEQKAKGQPLDASDLVNPWKQARISTVPLDTAVALATRSVSLTSKNYFQVAASGADIEDALKITGKEDLAENLVPLFYYENFTMTDTEGNKQTPLYFKRSELEQAYQKAVRNKMISVEEETPPVLVTELFATVREMVRPGGTDPDLKTVVFVAPESSTMRAKECRRKGGKEAAFLLGQRNVVL